MKSKAFSRYAWGILGYNVIVVLWGAFVRATGSGAGCGSHWPLCNGEVIPRAPELETIIEFSHRLSSGLLGFLMLGLVIWAFRLYGQGDGQSSAVRKASIWALFFVITEAIIGAGLVKFEWVADNDSVARIYTMSFHLVNTFFLLTALTLTAWFGSGGKPFSVRGRDGWRVRFGAAFVGLLALGVSGAITALGDTLHLQAGITAEQSPVVAWLLDVRLSHPIIAFGVFALVALAARKIWNESTSGRARQFGVWAVALFVAELVIGALNVWLKAPVWIQLVHLLFSNLIWVMMVLATAAALAKIGRPLSAHPAPSSQLKRTPEAHGAD